MKLIILFGKVLLSTLLLLLCFSIATTVVGLPGSERIDPSTALAALALMCFLDTVVLSFLIIHSRWAGWRLAIAVFLVFFGIMTFLSQIETVVFLQYLVEIVPAEMVPRFFAQGAITAALFSPMIVKVYGRMGGKSETSRKLNMSSSQWAWKLSLIAGIYVVVYILFGMFVFMPLAGQAAQEYYTGLQLPWWILPFQAIRGLIFAALAVLVVEMMEGSWVRTGLATALLFSVLMSASLIIPNEFMPSAIRFAHFTELFSSNFVFGWITIWILYLRKP